MTYLTFINTISTLNTLAEAKDNFPQIADSLITSVYRSTHDGRTSKKNFKNK